MRLRQRLLWAFLLPSLVLWVLAGSAVYRITHHSMEEEWGSRLSPQALDGLLSNLSHALFLVGIIHLFVIAAAAAFGAARLAAPLRRLVRTAKRMGEGDLQTPVQSERTAEIRVLAETLESMRQALLGRDRQLQLMLAGVAHEVRNPLGGMELFAGVLAEELKGQSPNLPEAHAHVERIRAELRYLNQIVERFLAFAREQTLTSASFSAKHWVHAAAELLEHEAEQKTVTVSPSVQDFELLGDANLLTAALVNLLKNAVQASRPGGAVQVMGREMGLRYVIQVVDQGMGIPADQQEKVFEPFFSTREKGSGLGLSLSRKIVQAHQGSLTVQSKPGETCFQISLPKPALPTPSN